MNIQEHLSYITELEVKHLQSPKIRGVTAYWEDQTACLTFYFEGEVTEKEIENASEVCTYIISNYPNGLLKETFLRWDSPKPLPEKFLVYKKPTG